MNCNEDHHNKKYTRRDFPTRTSLGMGALTLGGLLGPSPVLGKDLISQMVHSNGSGIPHFVPKAKGLFIFFKVVLHLNSICLTTNPYSIK